MDLDKIAESFTSLLKEHSYSKVTIQMICDNTPVSRNAFYYHFENKEKLAEWICRRDYVKYCVPFFHIKADNIRHKVFFTYIKENKDFYNALYAADGGQLLQHCLTTAYSDKISQETISAYALPVYSNKQKVEPKLFHGFVSAGIAAIVLIWIENGMKTPIDEIARNLTIMFTVSPEDILANHLL